MSLAVRAARATSQGGMSGNVQQGGILSSLRGAAKKVGGALLGATPAGQALSVSRNIFGSGLPQAAPGRPTTAAAPRGASLPGFPAGVARAIPGGQTGLGTGCPSGYHPNKTGYFLKSGGFVAAGTKCVRNRRRNPLNPRALSRAIGRIESGKRVAAKLSTISIRKKK